MEGKRGVCDLCATGFDCGRLSTALKLLDADPGLKYDRLRYERVLAVKRQLIECGWGYPDSGQHCQMAGKANDVRALTAELIELLDGRRQEQTTAADETSLYDEEVNND